MLPVTSTIARRGATAALAMMLGTSATFLGAGPVLAQAQGYPNKAIKIVVPFAPGGPTGVAARIATQMIQDAFGQPCVVENRPGAGGATGTRSVAQADADGYTLLMGTVATLGAVPAVHKNPGFDPVKSFDPVAQLTDSATIMIVPIQLPVNSVAEFVAHAKANPGKLNFGSAGPGNQTHLNAEVFKAKTGTDIVHVPFKSGAEMLTAILADQVQLIFSDISVSLPLIEAKKIKALAVLTPRRWPALPELPTIAEGGVPDFISVFWTGLLAPAGTPPEIVDKLAKVVNEGLKAPDVVTALTRIGSVPRARSPKEFGDYIASEAARWREAVSLAGVKVQ